MSPSIHFLWLKARNLSFHEIAGSNSITNILRSFVVALCFCGHVLGLIGACNCIQEEI